MHETSIAKSILDHVNKRIMETGKSALAIKVNVRVGEFTNVEQESLKFAFDSMKSSYPACVSCLLELETVRTVALCQGGTHIYYANQTNSFRCPECGCGIKTILAGKELEITDIELNILENKESVSYARSSK